MLTPEQIRNRALKRYPDFLRSLCEGPSLFPLSVFGGGLTRPNDFIADRAAIQSLRSQSRAQIGFGYELTWEQRTFRRLGTQSIPVAVSFTTQEDYVRFINKEREVSEFLADRDRILREFPDLKAWIVAKPLRVVGYSGNWDGLMKVCAYLRINPRPNCYLRELPVVTDTKFVEKHTEILAELLPIVAPLTVGPDSSGFESRFGFRSKQPMIRLRILDQVLASHYGFPIENFAMPLDEAASLPFAGVSVLVVENEMTFLTLPKLPGSLAIFGSGDASALLGGLRWLSVCRILYWGDIDSHGFEALSTLRSMFPNVISVLMDEQTYVHHSAFVVNASRAGSKERLRLTRDEMGLYEKLIVTGKLLEQERIHGGYSAERLRSSVA